MFISANEVNELGVDVAQRAFFDTVEKYQRIRGMALYDLYVMSYTNSPSVFDESSFLECLLQEHKNLVRYLISQMSGKLLLTPQMVDYAIAKAKISGADADEIADFCKVMTIYGTYLRSQNTLTELTTAYNKVKFRRNRMQHFPSRIKVTLEGLVTSTTPIVSCNAFGEYVTHYADEQLIVYDVRHKRWLLLAKKLGISQLIINESIKNNTALYIKGVSRDIELALFDELLHGDIRCDGFYGNKLAAFVNAHYNYTDEDNTRKYIRYIPDLARAVYAEFAEEINDDIEDFKATRNQWKIAPLQVMTNYVLFKEKKHDGVESDLAPYMGLVSIYEPKLAYEKRWSPFAVDYVTGTSLPPENRILGICGELIPITEVKKQGYAVMGIPAAIHKYQISPLGEVEDTVVYYYYVADVYYNGQLYEGEPVAKNVSTYPSYLNIVPQDIGEGNYVSRLSVSACIADIMRRCSFADIDVRKYSVSLLSGLLYADNCNFSTTIPTLEVDSLEKRQKALYVASKGYRLMKG